MKGFPAILIVALMLAVVLGLPLGLYALLTRGRRRSMREIREAASERGWQFRLRRWQGDPTAFRIEGRTGGGLAWILTSGGASGYDRGWSVRLALRFPSLGGEVDLAVLPREPERQDSRQITPHRSLEVWARVAAFSGTAASAVGFFRDARELPSGLPAFDTAYEVLALPGQSGRPPVDPALAQRILHWPADAIAPHSVLAWRDPFGLHLQARLPATPNVATVLYLVSLGEDLCPRVPAPAVPPAPRGFVDRLVARLLGS